MAPVGKSLERQRAEAQAKRAREEAETAAVYRDFVESFEQDGGNSGSVNDNRNSTNRHPPGLQHGRGNGQGVGFGLGNAKSAPGSEPRGAGIPTGPSKRHFLNTAGTKRPAASFSIMSGSRKKVKESVSSDKHDNALRTTTAAAFEMSDEEEEMPVASAAKYSTRGVPESKEAEKAAAKPTLHLSSLPPGMSPAAVKALLPSTLVVDNVKIISPSQLSSQSQQHQSNSAPKLWSAIATLAQDTPATDVDAVVSSLQNKYLGWGHYLSIFRHLSSLASNSMTSLLSGFKSSSNPQPFNAQPIRHGPSHLRGSRGRFAPPPSYHNTPRSSSSNHVVRVKIPSDLRELRLIHKTVENLISQGPAFEALLMTREEVQKEEKWAWLWDPSSSGGVYYRWRLYDVLTGARSCRRKFDSRVSDDGFHVFRAPTKWQPKAGLKFEFVTKLEEIVSDDDYDSSEEDDSDMEESRGKTGSRHHGDSDEERTPLDSNKHPDAGYLNTLQKAKLTHLLARLPTTNARLRKGDVARVTYFAIRHAGQGAQEVADTIVFNVAHPFAFTGANPEWQGSAGEKATKPDVSAAKLVGLFVISDILSVSATSGVRQAWRYRQLFEAALRSYNIFEHLGSLERELGWGRLKIEKWRRSVGSLLNIWEGWSVFPHESHEHFVKSFEKPHLAEEEPARQQTNVQQTKPEKSGPFLKQVKSRWKAVGEEAVATSANEEILHGNEDVDGISVTHQPVALDGQTKTIPPVGDYGSFDSLDGFPMEDSDLEELDFDDDDDDDDDEGEDDEDQEDEKSKEQDTTTRDDGSEDRAGPARGSTVENSDQTSQPHTQKRRPRAQDMFADSESE